MQIFALHCYVFMSSNTADAAEAHLIPQLHNEEKAQDLFSTRQKTWAPFSNLHLFTNVSRGVMRLVA